MPNYFHERKLTEVNESTAIEFFLEQNELFLLITDMERLRNDIVESLTEISTAAVMRNLTDISQMWTLEIPREIQDILTDAWIRRRRKIQKLQRKYLMKKGLTQFMEEKQQEYDERVKYWVQLVKAGERIVKRKMTQCEKMDKKVKKRPSLTLVRHLQIERKIWREKRKLRMERLRLQERKSALIGARNVLRYVKESEWEMREIVNRMKEKVEEEYRRLRELENSY